MHAVIHLALKKYMETRYGVQEWRRYLELAGVTTTLPYVRVGYYPDEELWAIVAAVAADRGIAVETVLEDFGAATAADLMAMYPRLIRPEWRSLDLICHTEQTIHQAVRRHKLGSRPPSVTCDRVSPGEVRLTYRSERRLCAFARGVIRGVADQYGEVLTVTQPVCMLRGDPVCELLVRLEPGDPAPP